MTEEELALRVLAGGLVFDGYPMFDAWGRTHGWGSLPVGTLYRQRSGYPWMEWRGPYNHGNRTGGWAWVERASP